METNPCVIATTGIEFEYEWESRELGEQEFTLFYESYHIRLGWNPTKTCIAKSYREIYFNYPHKELQVLQDNDPHKS